MQPSVIRHTLLISGLAGMLALSGCMRWAESTRPADPPVPPMPEATQVGRHTFGCYVNGNEWVARRQVHWTSAFGGLFGLQYDTLYASLRPYYHDTSSFELLLNAPINDSYRKISQEIRINIKLDSLRTGTYPILSAYPGYASYRDDARDCYYNSYTPPAVLGSITFSLLDTVGKVVSGTFFFTQPQLGNCPAVPITDGRFDLRLQHRH